MKFRPSHDRVNVRRIQAEEETISRAALQHGGVKVPPKGGRLAQSQARPDAPDSRGTIGWALCATGANEEKPPRPRNVARPIDLERRARFARLDSRAD